MKNYRAILITWIFLTLFLSIPMLGFMILLSFFIVFFFFIINLVKVLLKKSTWKDFFIRLGIILVGYCIIGSIHYIRYQNTRSYADSVVKQVLDYKNKKGYYPEISEIKLEDKDLFAGKVVYLYYNENKDNNQNSKEEKMLEPSIFYFDTFMIYASYHYDFNNHRWQYIGD